MPLRVLHVATEAFPYVKVGGLADVLGALPPALRTLGVDARLLLPGFPGVLERGAPLREARRLSGLAGRFDARLLSGTTDSGVPLYVLDVPELYGRSRDPYAEFGDSHLMAAALSQAACALAEEPSGGFEPAILHCHDWHTGLVPALLHHRGSRVPSIMTVHNLAYQGLFGRDTLPVLGLPDTAFTTSGVEFWGRVNLLKAGLVYATRVTTVSPRYAAEIQTAEGGHGLDGVLRARGASVLGILNGIDAVTWDPAHNSHLSHPYDVTRLEKRAPNKVTLLGDLKLDGDASTPLFGIVSRLNALKGQDLVLENVDHLVGLGARLAVVGKGDAVLESGFRAAAARHPGRVAFVGEQSEPRAHRIFAGVDLLLVPSRMEPCGLVQLYAMRYGAVPLVRYTGGLADTVSDETTGLGATGFTFDAPSGFALGAAITRAVGVFRRGPARFRELQRTGMSKDFSWDMAAQRYVALYEELVR